jgi:GNAT superfamily N-acetyltransferase
MPAAKASPPPHIRKATRDDGSALLSLVDALNGYEKLPPLDAAAKSRLIKDMCSEHPRFDAYLAEVDARAVGYAIVFETYSSFLALPTLYLEDLFVLQEYRGRNVGYALFKSMVAEAYRRGCGRMDWAVLDWNQLAIDFYKRIGATHLKEWQLNRLARKDMERILVNAK